MNFKLLLFFTLLILYTQCKPKKVIIDQIDRIGLGILPGPESLLWDPNNKNIVYTGIADGSIKKVNVKTNQVTHYAYVVPGLNETQRALCGTSPIHELMCGRPLGLTFDKKGNMWVADAYKGILKISKDDPNNVEVVVNSYNGVPFRFTNSLVFLKDGKTLYFTDSSQVYPRFQFPYVVIANELDARLFKYDTQTKKLKVVVNGFRFANGIAVSPNEDFLVIAETNTRKLWKYHLKGRKEGQVDEFVKDIGGIPDNVRPDGKGNYYVGCFTETSEELNAVQKFPNIRAAYLQHVPLPEILNIPKRIGLVKKVDKNGKVVQTFEDPTGNVIAAIAEADEHDGHLYFGSVLNPFIGKFKLPNRK